MGFEDLGFVMLILSVQWLYLPGYLVNTWAMLWGKMLPKIGFGPWPIDGGKIHKDGNRLLGDGKTWNGLVGGSLTSGLLAIIQVWLTRDRSYDSAPFIDLLWGIPNGEWYAIGGWVGTAFIIGTLLGFTSLIGDSVGSFIKRRRGLKREGDISSKAPLLDTLPFALFTFAGGLILLPNSLHSDSALIVPMIGLLILTPIIHRAFNLIGYKLGWKDVPY
jgi:CDP-2,3-bis-(O-geranylgeranyl)-sn-glycerol synthase